LIVTIVGCGEAFDDALPNTSLLVRTDVSVLLLDCGFSVPPHVWRAEASPDAIDLIYLSHIHADHSFGLPGLLGRMWEEGRSRPLTLMAQSSVLKTAEHLLDVGYPNLRQRFRFDLQLCSVDTDRTVTMFGCTFRFAETRHSARNLAIRIESGGAVLCYSGDGAITNASRELARGAGLWAQETYSLDPSDVHADIRDVLRSAEGAAVNRVALVHVARAVRRRRAEIFEAMLAAPVLCALPEPGSVFVL
jgi:ribonuclease BN (tRNA processing enzyme)